MCATRLAAAVVASWARARPRPKCSSTSASTGRASKPTSRRCRTTVSNASGLHVGVGFRRELTRGSIGARLELDDSTATCSSPSVRSTIGGTCRSGFALTAFAGAARLDLATPAYGYYFGGGVRAQGLWPRWNWHRPSHRRQARARQRAADRPAGRPARQLLRPHGRQPLLEPSFLSRDQAPRSLDVRALVERPTVAAAAPREPRAQSASASSASGSLRHARAPGRRAATARKRAAGTRSRRRAATSARERPSPAPRRAPCRTPRNAPHRGTNRAPRTNGSGCGSSGDSARRRARTSACARTSSGKRLEPTTRNRASGRAAAMRAAQSRKRSRPRFAKSPEVTKPTSGAAARRRARGARAARNCAARCERVAPRLETRDRERPPLARDAEVLVQRFGHELRVRDDGG